MRTIRFLLAVIGFGAFALGQSFADEPSRARTVVDVRDKYSVGSHPTASVHTSVTQANRSRGFVPGKTPIGPLNIPRKHSSANEVHQPAIKRIPVAANQGLMMNKMANHYGQTAKLPVDSANSKARPGDVHNAGAAAMGIGGLEASSARKSTAALDGAGIKRKAW